MDELVALFTVERVHSSPARFDMKKLEAINGEKIRQLSADEFFNRAKPFFEQVENLDEVVLREALPIVQERIVKLGELPELLNFLFIDNLNYGEENLAKLGEASAQEILAASYSALSALTEWSHESIEAALRSLLIEQMGLKPRNAFGAIRIAVTGSHISPPLFESMAILGQARSLTRIKAAGGI
jgi:glutamyl-tRNA synthetase